ncbi:MAG: IS200/IS605 family transposase [Lachnospiraceae bacterium]|nr:IS200/IS605 family transposase [Lachnospiraceae bacterium]
MDNLSLAHSKYNCTYHIVFIPKYRRKVMFGNLRKEVGEAISKVCKIEGVTILKAATLPDHVHMYVSIPPKESVAKVVGRIKGKSSLILFDRHPEYRERYNRHFWARGYYCETIGNVNEATITKYIVLRGKLRAAETAAYFRRYSLPDCACGHQTAHNHYDERRASVTC